VFHGFEKVGLTENPRANVSMKGEHVKKLDVHADATLRGID